MLTFSLAAFAFASIGRTIGVGVRARRRAHQEAIPVATARMVRANPRLYGGLVVHIGVVVVAVAGAGSVLAYAGVGALMDDPNVTRGAVRSLLPTAVVYDVVLSAFVLPAVLAVARRAEADQAAFA